MLDYGNIVYLDPQKTGSTFIADFLDKHLSVARKRYRKHAPVRGRYNPSAFHFISVRNPVDQYVSLYRYGLETGGRLRRKFGKSGLGHLYEGTPQAFNAWLEKLLNDPEIAKTIGDGYDVIDHTAVGLQSFRFLRLSFQHPLVALRGLRTHESLHSFYEDNRLHRHVVRTETLNKDMRELVHGSLKAHMRNVRNALEDLNIQKPVNATKRIGVGRAHISSANLSAIQGKERFLLELFYPNELKLAPIQSEPVFAAKAA